MKTIEITIDAEGGIVVEAKGYKGRSCKDATKAIEAALGAVETVEDKPELYQAESVVTVGTK